jgi:hypothetical protein
MYHFVVCCCVVGSAGVSGVMLGYCGLMCFLDFLAHMFMLLCVHVQVAALLAVLWLQHVRAVCLLILV